ncbi:hypothetical protein RB195_019014 [Necator americanus]|uniref:Uncharacterized protein n=1 Tax=Necator americanus TaxID=51031 RepID=A0ABR1CDB6_NECAM
MDQLRAQLDTAQGPRQRHSRSLRTSWMTMARERNEWKRCWGPHQSMNRLPQWQAEELAARKKKTNLGLLRGASLNTCGVFVYGIVDYGEESDSVHSSKINSDCLQSELIFDDDVIQGEMSGTFPVSIIYDPVYGYST